MNGTGARVGADHRASRAFVVLVLLHSAAMVEGGPNRYGHSDRVERHMLPAVSTGPLDPAWSPDGRWIAFSMRGDIWKVPAEGGTAIALTAGPAYHFEPAWSPDGAHIALSFDRAGNLDIGVVPAGGGTVRRLTTAPGVDVQPAWSADGSALFYVTDRAGGFRIARHDLTTGRDTILAPGTQPAVSPDGGTLAYVAPLPGRLGAGGIHERPLPDGEARLVRAEETSYRTKPAWTRDGHALLYVSDETGRNEIRILPAVGGDPIVLTADAWDEYSPAPSPDGRRFAFVSNHAGPTTLYTVDHGGGPRGSWREVAIRARTFRLPTGRVRVRVLDPDGTPIAARVHVDAGDGRSHAPDGAFHRVISATETHYFHTSGEFEIEVPAGRTKIEALRGYDHVPHATSLDVLAGETADITLTLHPLLDLPSRGWYSGDTHIHDLHQGRFGLTHETFFLQLVAEDLNVTHALIHMDGSRLMGRWEDLTGEPHPLSTATHILQYGQEFRGSLGHIALLGVREYVLPFTAGVAGTAYAQPTSDLAYLDGARAQGGIAGYVHPYIAPVRRPQDLATSLIPVDIALGRGEFYDVAAIWSDEVFSSEVYYRLLNAGFRIAATGGTDNFSDVWRDPPPGSARTYVRIEGPLTLNAWLDGVRAGRTFASTGPLLFLDVEGRGPGEEIAFGAGTRPRVRVRAEAVSIAPMDSLEIIVNGRAVRRIRAGDPLHIMFDGAVDVPEGGWVAARVLGPASRYVADSYAFAQTSPVYIVRGGRPWVSVDDARFFMEGVDALWSRIERSRWRSGAERDAFRAVLDSARAVFAARAGVAAAASPAASR